MVLERYPSEHASAHMEYIVLHMPDSLSLGITTNGNIDRIILTRRELKHQVEYPNKTYRWLQDLC